MKRLFSILSLILICSVLLSSCGKGGNTTTTTTNKPAVIVFDFLSLNISDYVSLPASAFNSFSVSLNSDDYKVTDEDVMNHIHELQTSKLQNCPTYTENTDRPSVKNDYVSFYFTVYVDGVTYYTNMTDAKPARIKVGTSEYMSIEGFEQGLIGIVPNTTSVSKRTEGTVGADDIVYFTYACTYYDHDGKLITSESKINDRIVLSSPGAYYGTDFASNLIGAQIGEQKQFTIYDDYDGDGEPESKTYEGKVMLVTEETCVTIEGAFPKAYYATPAVAGKKAIIEVVVLSVGDPVYPELTTSFVTDTMEFKTDKPDVIAEFKAQIRSYLESNAQMKKRADTEQRILDTLVAAMTLKSYPVGSVEFYYQPQLEEYTHYFTQDYEYNEYYYGSSPYQNVGEYITYVENLEEGTDGEAWLYEQCRKAIRENLVIYYLGEVIGISHSKAALLDYCEVISEQVYQNLGEQYSAEYILAVYGEQYIASLLIYGEVMEYCNARTTVN